MLHGYRGRVRGAMLARCFRRVPRATRAKSASPPVESHPLMGASGPLAGFPEGTVGGGLGSMAMGSPASGTGTQALFSHLKVPHVAAHCESFTQNPACGARQLWLEQTWPQEQSRPPQEHVCSPQKKFAGPASASAELLLRKATATIALANITTAHRIIGAASMRHLR